jgi:Na+/alanine symporter
MNVIIEPTVAEASSSVFPSNGELGNLGNNDEAKNIVEKIFEFANVFAGIVLAISIVMIILGGLRYITAQGDPKAVEQGKMILIYSGIGIIIALSAFALARFFTSFAV